MASNTLEEKKSGKLVNDYEFASAEYAVKQTNLKVIGNVHLCTFLWQYYICHQNLSK